MRTGNDPIIVSICLILLALEIATSLPISLSLCRSLSFRFVSRRKVSTVQLLPVGCRGAHEHDPSGEHLLERQGFPDI